MKKIKIAWICCFAIAAAALAVGASFHGYRINPDDAEKFKLGVAMGVSMLGIFAVFAAAGIVLFILWKKKK